MYVMTTKLHIKLKAKKIGPSSIGFLIPKEVVKAYKILDGEIYNISIEYSENILFECQTCNYRFNFDGEDYEVYCPACGSEDISGFKKLENKNE